MKKILLLTFGLVSLVTTAQKTIVEEKFEKDNVPLSYNFLQKSNKLVIQKGKHVGVSTNREVHSLNSYDANGNKQALLNDGVLMNVSFSTFYNSFIASEYAAMKWSTDFKVYHENQVSNLINKEERTSLFNKDYSFSVVNTKGKSDIDMDKEDVFLQKYSFKDKKSVKIKLEKPSLNSINKAEYYKLKEINYKRIFRKDYFEFVTKIIKKDCKSATIFRTLYNYDGKIIKKMELQVSIDNPFTLTNNGGGNLKYVSQGNITVTMFDDQLSINNFIIDQQTDDIYLYGLYGKKGKESLNSDLTGYYVIKFDSSGKQIWQQSHDITDKQLNSFGNAGNLFVSSFLKNDKLNFIIYSEKYDEFLFYKDLNLSNGNEIKGNKITYKEDKVYTMMTGTRDFILSFYKIDKTKIRFDAFAIVYFDSNKKFKSYIDSIASSEKKIYLNTLSSKEGIWLIESDNETYYKVTYFTHE